MMTVVAVVGVAGNEVALKVLLVRHYCKGFVHFESS